MFSFEVLCIYIGDLKEKVKFGVDLEIGWILNLFFYLYLDLLVKYVGFIGLRWFSIIFF